ncbi:MAG: polysaccharide biosynthesis protein PslG, partial [Thermoleophilaceae bacterium]|nr:polysaccharide biosynthesis protein PslG [Thermoleophilaceae bacterium]
MHHVSRKGITGLVALAAVLACALPTVAAAERIAPRGFFGANWNFEITEASDNTKRIAWDQMAAAGVESQRLLFEWRTAQPVPHGTFDFAASDADLERALRHRMELLPVVAGAPRWARESDAPNSPPSDPSDYAAYLRALVVRYGPVGTFWAEHADLPMRPIRTWQIWNEPSRNYQWTISKGEKWAPGYGALLRASYPAIKDADTGARVVIAGLPNRSWRALDRLYREGHVHGYFDVGAVHPYTLHDHGVLTIVKNYRNVMRDHGDGGKAIRVTEMGIPASKGRDDSDFPLQTDDAGQIKFLRQSYNDLVANRKQLHVTRVNWFTWASSYNGHNFAYSGLVAYTPGGEG